MIESCVYYSVDYAQYLILLPSNIFSEKVHEALYKGMALDFFKSNKMKNRVLSNCSVFITTFLYIYHIYLMSI